MPEQTAAGTVVYTAEELIRERRCIHHKACACSHTECRDGWLDEEEHAPRPGKPDRTIVVRCPHCYDAALMAAELAPTPRGRKW